MLTPPPSPSEMTASDIAAAEAEAEATQLAEYMAALPNPGDQVVSPHVPEPQAAAAVAVPAAAAVFAEDEEAEEARYALSLQDLAVPTSQVTVDHGSLSKSKRSMLRHEWVLRTHTLTLSMGRRPALNRTFTFSNSAIPTLVLAPITDPDAGHSNTLLDFCIFLVQRVLVTADPPSWDLQLRSDPPSFSEEATKS